MSVGAALWAMSLRNAVSMCNDIRRCSGDRGGPVAFDQTAGSHVLRQTA